MYNKTQEQISYNMRQIKCKDTKIELILRKELWSRGLRYRKNVKDLPGKPDIVFIGKKVAVFCDSEFFHGYNWIERKNSIKSNREYWITKIEHNMERDLKINEILEKTGWTVLRFWGKEILTNPQKCADIIQKILAEKTNAQSI